MKEIIIDSVLQDMLSVLTYERLTNITKTLRCFREAKTFPQKLKQKTFAHQQSV